jgi:F-type H+-transporting ATPase subunit b
MQIDWTTFLLEITNFLALVWILKRFLYKPVLETLAQRRAGIERTLAEAKETEAQARALQLQYEKRLADWDKEKEAARAQFEAKMAVERTRQMQALAKTLAEERERRAAVEAHRQEESRREMEARALTQARRFAAGLLSRLAGPELETRLVDVFIEDLSILPEDKLTDLRAAVQAQEVRASVASAFPLYEAQRKRIEEIIATRLGMAIPVDFGEDGTLLAGVRVSVGPWQLKMNLADELAFFAAASDHVD